MKAFGLANEGAPAAVIEVPTPEPGPGEVRVKVWASSVNGFDVFVAKGMARGMMEHRYPVVIGKDHAGEIDALGEGVTGFAVGDEVTGIVPTEPHLWRGAYAEFVAVPLDGFIVHKPGNLDFKRAACLGLAALTAFHCVETVEASEGDVVHVVGATGAWARTPFSSPRLAVPRSSRRRCLRTRPGSVGSARTRSWITRATSWRRCWNGIPRASTA